MSGNRRRPELSRDNRKACLLLSCERQYVKFELNADVTHADDKKHSSLWSVTHRYRQRGPGESIRVERSVCA